MEDTNMQDGNSFSNDPAANLDSSTSSDVTQGQDIDNNGGGDGTDNVNYEKRYQDSSREAKRLKEENTRLAKERAELEEYSTIGRNFVQRYNDDETFKSAVDSAVQKRDEGKTLTKGEKELVKTADNNADMPTMSEDDYQFLQRQKVEAASRDAENARQMALKNKQFGEMISEIEGDDADEIDTKTIRYFDKNEGKYKEANPVREAIYKVAQIHIMNGMDEKQAYTQAYKQVRKPESLASEAMMEGQLIGLESQIAGSYNMGNKSAVGNDGTTLNQYDRAMLDKLGSKVDPKVYASIKARG